MFQVRLKELREKAGLSQSALAKKLGVVQSTVGMWENGKNKPENARLEALANFFSVSVDYLLGRDESAQPAAQGSELDRELTDMIKNLSDGDLQRVKDFVAGLKSAREGQSSPQK